MNPFNKFKKWFSLAEKNYPFDHTAFSLGTTYDDKPYVRMVLLKIILNDGFVFFTDLNSKKGKHFSLNNNLSMCFYWESIKKQIRVEGKASVIDKESSDHYFSSRPRGSQIGSWVSKQSSTIHGKNFLKQREIYFKKKFKDSDVPRPKYWVGIKIKPLIFEFWQQGKYRLHKREFFYLKNKIWERKILSP
ncbi:MAG: pyridoxamine 5'-phosphate oxidase [Pseudomonadota bacterium]|nr:pyridoxamine 5'-phosphate oxidase [Pseudomonadota bacterium]